MVGKYIKAVLLILIICSHIYIIYTIHMYKKKLICIDTYYYQVKLKLVFTLFCCLAKGFYITRLFININK